MKQHLRVQVLVFAAFFSVSTMPARADAASIDDSIAAVAPAVLEWRRDFHRNPELSNREFRTSKIVAAHLRKLGLEVRTGIAHTGVVGILRGGQAGPVIGLRADMDALPVIEQTDLPFRSLAKAEYRGDTVGVMHACGHDVHTAVLMGVAQVLAAARADLPGTVMFVFQPAEEGAPVGEQGGASLMIKEGLFADIKPEAMFGLHVMANLPAGLIGYRAGPFMAASDFFSINVRGRQTHGARPWGGVDPIVTSAQIINALQTIVSRQIDITENPAIVTIGAIKGGVRYNIVPDEVEMLGTLRTFTGEQRKDILERMERIAQNVALANGATATLTVNPGNNPVTYNNPELTERILPSLRAVAGADQVKGLSLITGAEDFAYYAKEIPSVFFFVGVTPRDQNPLAAPSNHSPLFFVDESAIPVATRALTRVALDYLRGGATH
ncbi:MAG: amidohydrolase [Steroidobacteraceae bacterium]